MEAKYQETQQMTQTWSKAALVIVMIALWFLALASYMNVLPQNGYMGWEVMVIVTVVLAAVVILALFLKMKVTVTDDEIRIKTILTRVIRRSEIESLEIRDKIYAVREYGGWGIRWWVRGIGYIAPGNNGGVEVHTAEGKHGIMISSKDPQALLDALKS